MTFSPAVPRDRRFVARREIGDVDVVLANKRDPASFGRKLGELLVAGRVPTGVSRRAVRSHTKNVPLVFSAHAGGIRENE